MVQPLEVVMTFTIHSDCNTVGNSYPYFPYSYVCDEYANPGNSDFLADTYKFTVTEIEVYSV